MSNFEEALIQARALLQDRSHWTQGSFARLADGLPTTPEDPNAVQWCAYGAIQKFVPRYSVHVHIQPAVHLTYPGFHSSLVEVNDMIGYIAAMRVLDKAIELFKEPHGS